MDTRLSLIGLLAGLLVGLTGVGGSAVATPLMILVLGIPPTVAVAIDLAYSAPTRLFGAVLHWRQGTIDTRLVGLLAIGGLPATLIGLLVVAWGRAHLGIADINRLVRHDIGIVLALVACGMLLMPLVRSQRQTRSIQPPSPPYNARALPVLGAIVGFLVSVTSIGGGSLTMPMLTLIAPRLGLHRLVGTDVAFSALLMPIAAVGYALMGTANLPLSASLLLGALPGVYVGSTLCAQLPDFWLRPTIAGVLLLAGSRLI